MLETICLEDEGGKLHSHKTRITSNQFAVMVDFMTLNPELIRRDFSGTFTKEHYVQKWEELTALLNADFTGAKKDNQSWRKCWRDRKSHLKIKAERRDARISEGTDPSCYQLTDLEERLLQLIKENEPDNSKYSKEGKKPSNHLKANNIQQDVKNLNIQQKIKDNVSQILGILNKQERTNSTNQVVNNPVSQQDTMNNIPEGILPTSYVLLAVDANTVPSRLQAVPPPSLILNPSNNVLMQVDPLSDTSVRNDSIPDPLETIVSSNRSCLTIDFNSNPSNKNGIQDSKKRSNTEKINHDTQESTAKDIKSNSSVFKNSKGAVSNNDEDIFVPRSKFDEELSSSSSDEDSLEKHPRKKIRFTNHTESLFFGEDEGGLVKVIERQNHILEGMARTLARIEKSLGERHAEEAQRKNSMLVKISDNLDLLGESLRTVSKSLKSIGGQ